MILRVFSHVKFKIYIKLQLMMKKKYILLEESVNFDHIFSVTTPKTL